MRKNNQTGRSMVEMLGVLAIIGVLSVGAIAGYQKAMFKYKLNKLKNQIIQIVANIQTLYVSANKNTWNDKVINKLIMIEGMGTNGLTDCRHAMGGACYVGTNLFERKYMKIGFMDLSYEACLDVATMDFTGLQYTTLVNALNNPQFSDLDCNDESGKNKCLKSSKKVTIDQIKEVCGHELNAVVWYFENDLKN